MAGLGAAVRRMVAADGFSGAVLVAKNGHVLFSHAYGLADRERRISNTLQTRFRIGSMNKMFTARSHVARSLPPPLFGSFNPLRGSRL
jgi:CubicO group peptidase (beta-lactamase class C family)